MVSGTMSLFDPLGQAANVIVKAKIIMRECLRLSWDEVVSDGLREKWRNWCLLLEDLGRQRIPRFIGVGTMTKWEHHTFVDASEEAYAAGN